MATVNVTTFSEFRTAAAQSGNTIICPNNAVWDMATIDPENTITSFEINSNITGNGTEIRNFRGKIICGNSITITALHIINMLCETGSTYTGAIYTSYKEWIATMKQCRISIATGSAVKNALYNVRPQKCAINLQMAYAYNCVPVGNYQWWGDAMYNQILINAPNATGILKNDEFAIERSKIIIYAPLATGISTLMKNCTIRGNLQNVTASSSSSALTPFSVISADAAPNFPENSGYIKKVTDEQMRDADYLASIGFVIGTE